MPNFLCLQRSLPTTDTAATPADMKAMYARFAEWQARFKDQIVDLGGRLGAGTVVADTSADGPFVEVKELVGGYMIVSAPSLEGAIEVASSCPGLVRPGSGVEVIEIRTS